MNNKEIKKILGKYTTIIEKLREKGVIRSGKVVGDYGEYIASKKLKLKLVASSVNKGYDAKDEKGNKYEIKTRKATKSNNPIVFLIKYHQLAMIKFLIYVEFDNEWNLVRFLKIPVQKLKPIVNKHNTVVVTQDLIKKFSLL